MLGVVKIGAKCCTYGDRKLKHGGSHAILVLGKLSNPICTLESGTCLLYSPAFARTLTRL